MQNKINRKYTFFLFHFSFVFFKYIIKQDNLRQDIATVKNEKREEEKKGQEKGKKKKEIDFK